jgi:hypothetical protein
VAELFANAVRSSRWRSGHNRPLAPLTLLPVQPDTVKVESVVDRAAEACEVLVNVLSITVIVPSFWSAPPDAVPVLFVNVQLLTVSHRHCRRAANKAGASSWAPVTDRVPWLLKCPRRGSRCRCRWRLSGRRSPREKPMASIRRGRPGQSGSRHLAVVTLRSHPAAGRESIVPVTPNWMVLPGSTLAWVIAYRRSPSRVSRRSTVYVAGESVSSCSGARRRRHTPAAVFPRAAL